MHLFISQILLYRFERIVVMDPSCSFRGTYHFRNLLVRQTLLHPQREDLTLRGRKPGERFSYALLYLLRDEPIEGSVLTNVIRFLHGNRFPTPAFRPSSIQHQPPLDREEPRPEGAFATKRIERCKRSNEGILHQLLYPFAFPGAGGEPRQRQGMSTHQPSCGPTVARLPAID